jgi:hypothetical protein
MAGAFNLLIAAAWMASSGLVDATTSTSAVRERLVAEIARWTAFTKSNESASEDWKYMKEPLLKGLGEAEQALRSGRPLAALHRLQPLVTELGAFRYQLAQIDAGRKGAADLEQQWTQLGPAVLAPVATTDAQLPAAVQAVAETAEIQVRQYYQASPIYGRNTTPEAGLYYLGAAQGSREFAAFCRTLGPREGGRDPALRSLLVELDRLDREVLDAYEPPASIDKHPAFIRLGATMKLARELDAAGRRHGALYKYLESRMRLGQLTPAAAPESPEALKPLAESFAVRLSTADVDHSIGRLFLELALPGITGTPTPEQVETARVVLKLVLPRYFEALAPAPPAPTMVASRATVTLVRWPYT